MLRPLTVAAVVATAVAQLQEKKFCSVTGLIVSEYYGRIYTDVVRSNSNEVFVYNATAKTLMAKSNGQCLEVYAYPPHPYLGYGSLSTLPCDASKALQQWSLENDRVYIAKSKYLPAYCMESHNAFRPGSTAGVGPCDFSEVAADTVVDCATVKDKYITIKTLKTGNRLSEYYTGLYANAPANNANELFVWDKPNKMFKVASNNQCLDAYKDANGKFQVHTWACDVKNGNQKWNFNPTTKTLEHATHTGQCLDADPTYTDRHAQMWACTPNNANQQWSIDTFYG
ncbi:hypothetical protein SPRG_20539 [Saprolegnia parasitica CBS 223.65]|uniref:Ricin B lectin domain-containing protein n=1 Tax=Saprolegnia parasitica (strain CBS 223.65) TaxID=695850 RepID=A0A067CJN9_SAPPC|nr:hypothetical protein SPRG_20539 [Saprolegnia parasitica CBS 223.65]KDO26741.1 hypothetical protein SPRG_20539 [Saprolegnia parasitica CBS 223.65]|eukprot:XP_012202621.1 hypothetical protein SPRG_20539 [Saprolegnia parasitica CBS 223.65]